MHKYLVKQWNVILGVAMIGIIGPMMATISVCHAVDQGPDAKINRQLPGGRNGTLIAMIDDNTAKIDGISYMVGPQVPVATDSGKLVPRPAGWYTHFRFPIRVQYWTQTQTSGKPAIFQMVLLLGGK